ncbi:MAG: hypothetical protein AAFZ07_08485 [Actinomycetota bacterium]
MARANRAGRRRTTTTLAVALMGLAALGGCGDDDSAQDRYCEAGESLRSSIGALADLDLIAGGTDGLDEVVSEIADDVGELRDAAGDATEDDVAALDSAVDGLRGSLSELGGELTRENVGAVGDAASSVADAAQAVFATLGDC